jgi:hypothetical protein
MEEYCPICGASPVDGKSCEDIFNEFLVLEFTDPDYGTVHMITVAAYMVQHGRYSDEGLVWIKEQLRRHLEGVSFQEIRREASSQVSNSSRGWKVTRPTDAPPLPKVNWSMTIADVAKENHDAESYCRSIRKWGKVTLDEMP